MSATDPFKNQLNIRATKSPTIKDKNGRCWKIAGFLPGDEVNITPSQNLEEFVVDKNFNCCEECGPGDEIDVVILDDVDNEVPSFPDSDDDSDTDSDTDTDSLPEYYDDQYGYYGPGETELCACGDFALSPGDWIFDTTGTWQGPGTVEVKDIACGAGAKYWTTYLGDYYWTFDETPAKTTVDPATFPREDTAGCSILILSITEVFQGGCYRNKLELIVKDPSDVTCGGYEFLSPCVNKTPCPIPCDCESTPPSFSSFWVPDTSNWGSESEFQDACNALGEGETIDYAVYNGVYYWEVSVATTFDYTGPNPYTDSKGCSWTPNVTSVSQGGSIVWTVVDPDADESCDPVIQAADSLSIQTCPSEGCDCDDAPEFTESNFQFDPSVAGDWTFASSAALMLAAGQAYYGCQPTENDTPIWYFPFNGGFYFRFDAGVPIFDWTGEDDDTEDSVITFTDSKGCLWTSLGTGQNLTNGEKIEWTVSKDGEPCGNESTYIIAPVSKAEVPTDCSVGVPPKGEWSLFEDSFGRNLVDVIKLDDEGNPVLDEDGNPVIERLPVGCPEFAGEKVINGRNIRDKLDGGGNENDGEDCCAPACGECKDKDGITRWDWWKRYELNGKVVVFCDDPDKNAKPILKFEGPENPKPNDFVFNGVGPACETICVEVRRNGERFADKLHKAPCPDVEKINCECNGGRPSMYISVDVELDNGSLGVVNWCGKSWDLTDVDDRGRVEEVCPNSYGLSTGDIFTYNFVSPLNTWTDSNWPAPSITRADFVAKLKAGTANLCNYPVVSSMVFGGSFVFPLVKEYFERWAFFGGSGLQLLRYETQNWALGCYSNVKEFYPFLKFRRGRVEIGPVTGGDFDYIQIKKYQFDFSRPATGPFSFFTSGPFSTLNLNKIKYADIGKSNDYRLSTKYFGSYVHTDTNGNKIRFIWSKGRGW